MKKLILMFIMIFLLPLAISARGSMPLLAVRQTDAGYEGSTAELFLEIKEGTGRVFVDTFPLSKIDTQISMRLAKEIACDFLEKGCDNYDFIYTITANSPIIAGPSAGASAAVLTASQLSNTPLKDKIAITGTINSGGLIGPVGGLKEKINAGAGAGLKTILIPQGEIEETNESSNISVNLIEYGNSLGVKVIETADLNSALEFFTGRKFRSFDEKITISESYEETMKTLASGLCSRNLELKGMISPDNFPKDIENLYIESINLSKKGETAFQNKEFYSAASYCFGSNVKLNQVFLEMKNFSEPKYEGLLKELIKEIKKFDDEIEKKQIETITDLESYMVVKERLLEAIEYANSTKNASYPYAYAYANERLRSAYSWAEFFKNKGKKLEMDKESLKGSCQQRIAEAEERLQYTSLYLPFRLSSPREELDKAYDDFNSNQFALCLFRASKAKAEANIVLNTLGVGQEFIPQLIENKLKAASLVIIKAEKKDIFPILGYSYFEYANNLKENDRYSSLLYAEYALELSNLDVYFKEKNLLKMPKLDNSKLFILIAGLILGFLISSLIRRKPRSFRKK